MKRWLLSALAAMVLVSAHPLAAQPVAEFYKGKKIEIVIGFTPGGTYDLYSRTLAEFMEKHIPGRPQILVVNKPGASSLNAAQHVSRAAPHDGLTIGMTTNLLPLEQLLEGPKAKVDMSKVRWIGNLVELQSAMIVWHTQPVKTLEDLKKTEVIFGSTGPSGETYMVPVLASKVLGVKIKMVTGYPGNTEVALAMEKGEVGGRSSSWQNVTQRPHWIEQKLVTPILQVGSRKHRDLPNVPLFSEVVTDPADKRIVDLMSISMAISRALWVGETTPEDRVTALRAAFDTTMKDPDFIAATKQRKLDLDPMPGVEIDGQLRKALDMPPEIVARMRKHFDLN
jgi:tripartite-type tricarboxylate transporter receptor subunit TctC